VVCEGREDSHKTGNRGGVFGFVSYIKSALHRNYSSLCSRTLRSLRTLRFNHSNATGIHIKARSVTLANNTSNSAIGGGFGRSKKSFDFGVDRQRKT